MKHAEFVHLHVHTQYSLLDGAIRLDDLMHKAKEYHMPAITMTDHGNMFGTIDFYEKATKSGLKPIIGCEMYLAPGSRFDKEASGSKGSNNHIILLSINRTGYHNLLKLVSAAYIEGMYYKPRIDKQILREHHDGLIALSACLHGEIPHAILAGDMKQALALADEYRQLFDNERFYLELQENKLDDQRRVNEGLIEISKKTGIPMVATNDCHYLNSGDAFAHEVLLCIQTGKTITMPDRMRFTTQEFYFKSPEEMQRAFSSVPEALKNTIAIAERCNLEVALGEYKFPNFTPPAGKINQSYFEEMSRTGLEERLEKIRQARPEDFDKRAAVYRKRLEDEIKMITQMKFTTYFLIVADFIKYAKNNGCPVGPGRGSAAGSLVAYTLGITEIDPIENNLLFERFLNPERISPPDIDVDFCQENRDRIIKYVTDKYGKENVAQIITFGRMNAKGVIRDVGRALDMPYKEVDTIAKLVPADPKMTIDLAILQEPRLKDLIDNDEQVQKLITISKALEGLARHASTHAAGVVIADAPLDNYLPLCKSTDGVVMTQFEMKGVEAIGLIKFDFLGLKTLTVIEKSVEFVRANPANDLPDINNLPLNDPKSYELLSSGETDGVFQLESSGMKELLTRIQPGNIEDLTALLALYRPGPLGSGMVDDFVACKHGKKAIAYPLPQLEDVLKETYGIILYQEQVMRIASTLAGFSLADADLLRRAMGKKKKEEMLKQKEKFLEGAKKNKVNQDKAADIFALMEKFAEYGFNKSHSAAYASITYQTAYLKAHFPVEFMAALLSSEMGNTDKVVNYISECREKHIDVLPPDVNDSIEGFNVVGNKIRFGLAAVKNVGSAAIESIIAAREKDGPFRSLLDFCRRVDLRKVNKKVVESLIKCGAMDSFGAKRSQLMAVADDATAMVQREQKEKAKNQMSMFAAISEKTGAAGDDAMVYPDLPDWDQKERLNYEKECLGFYVTGHPLDHYMVILRACTSSTTASAAAETKERAITIGGVVSALRSLTTKKGGKLMAHATLEDVLGTIKVVVFPKQYAQYESLLKSEHPIIVKGDLKIEAEGNSILATEIVPIEKAYEIATPEIHVKCHIHKVNDIGLSKMKGVLKNNPGKSKVYMHVVIPGSGETVISFGDGFKTSASPLLITEVESIMGKHSVHFH
jgi:DNA polymerase III subunit alpha